MQRTTQILFLALLSATNLIAMADSSQPQIITGKVIEKETELPVDCTLGIRHFFLGRSGEERHAYTATYGCRENGEFTFTNQWEETSRIEIEIDNNKYQYQLISGSFEPGTNDWGTIELSKRPFYFENSRINDDDPNIVKTTVINTTGKRAYMRFWLTGRVERLDDSEYFGCNSESLLKLKRGKKRYKTYATYRLVPGENKIKFKLKDYGSNISVSRIKINGGRSSSNPMIVSQFVMHEVTKWFSPGGPIPIPLPRYTNVITNIVYPGVLPGLTNLVPRPVVPTNPPITLRSHGIQSGSSMSTPILQ